MTLEEIRELINLATETGVAELEVQRGDDRVRIRRVRESRHPAVVASAHHPHSGTSTQSQMAPPGTPEADTMDDQAAEDILDPTLIIVKAPIVGTFYEAPAPGSASFVQIGDAVQPGKVLCIIESMKLMNEIEAEVAGTLVRKLVGNGQAVEYGEALFAIKPV